MYRSRAVFLTEIRRHHAPTLVLAFPCSLAISRLSWYLKIPRLYINRIHLVEVLKNISGSIYFFECYHCYEVIYILCVWDPQVVPIVCGLVECWLVPTERAVFWVRD